MQKRMTGEVSSLFLEYPGKSKPKANRRAITEEQKEISPPKQFRGQSKEKSKSMGDPSIPGEEGHAAMQRVLRR